MHSLTGRCSHAFSETAMQRGAACLEHRQVKLGNPADHRLKARVVGSSTIPYDAEVDWSWARERQVLWVSCTCPRFQDGQRCEHLWATLLGMEARNLGRLIPGQGKLDVLDDEIYEEDEEDEEVEEAGTGAPGVWTGGITGLSFAPRPGEARRRAQADWRELLATLDPPPPEPQAGGVATPAPRRITAAPQPVWYLVNLAATLRQGQLVLDFYQVRRESGDTAAPLRPYRVDRADMDTRTLPEDRQLLELLLGPQPEPDDPAAPPPPKYSRTAVPAGLHDLLLPRLTASGRFGWVEAISTNRGLFRPLSLDLAEPWRLTLAGDTDEEHDTWRIHGSLRRGSELAPLNAPVVALRDGLIVFPDKVGRLAEPAAYPWLALIREQGPLVVPRADRDEFLRRLWRTPPPRDLDLPPELSLAVAAGPPVPRLAFEKQRTKRTWEMLDGLVWFDYPGQSVRPGHSEATLLDLAGGRVIVRDAAQEAAALAQLESVGLRNPSSHARPGTNVEVAARHMPRAARELINRGWRVEAEGKRIRAAGANHITVKTTIDWFELEGSIEFDDQSVTLPELLAAARRGDRYVALGDGSQGLLPEEWLDRIAPLVGLGRAEGDRVRFLPAQATLLESLLSTQADADFDDGFRRLCARLNNFDGIAPRDQPPGFEGKLREYQRLGLGWLHFLAEFGFGGCLADDMGLGKTIQVLALLEERRAAGPPEGEARRPSLVVVPRSLVHNWIEEATRFTPHLRVLDYTGQERVDHRERMEEYDLVITTYGTVRRDILALQEITFDYAILDEAQAIKNVASQAAKACRLIKARHRLAMSGTPVENHLGELWSIFDFLNPGMLGRGTGTGSLLATARDPESLAILARALRPFILRRTKDQVLKELPKKTEQTLYCELEPKQRKLYDSLRVHYRAELREKIDSIGFAKARMHVLEALLRLRQAACHPGLIDKARVDEGSAKLDALLESLREIQEEGHKALVFSQFTSLLAIVRAQLDREGIVYEYLDGRTVKRAEKVKRFQTDAACPIFLISLKAGGQGLNLTAADYVFILDPWWNPAVEAQAVDRAHRIGQERRVFAYRLIARDTVEEKILELQRQKRHLAEAIVSAEPGVIKGLTAEDLQLLLS